MKRFICTFMCLLLTAALCLPVFADEAKAREAVRSYIAGLDVSAVGAGYINGEWSILAAARSGEELPDGLFDAYYSALCSEIEANGGVLNERRYTDYSRTVIGLTAAGKDPENAAGCNMLEKLADMDAVEKQGLNGTIYALIALDCGGYEIPRCPDGKTQAGRALYIEHILSRQNSDGSFSLSGSGDADVTAMALQALSNYTDRSDVKESVERALAWLSAAQCADGGFATVGEETCESAAQVLTALGELGIDPDTDPRFIKNGITIPDNILTYRLGSGFKHLKTQQSADPMATEQAVYALVSYLRQRDGLSSLYDMSEKKEDEALLKQKVTAWADMFMQAVRAKNKTGSAAV